MRRGACAGGLPLSVGADAQRRAWTPRDARGRWLHVAIVEVGQPRIEASTCAPSRSESARARAAGCAAQGSRDAARASGRHAAQASRGGDPCRRCRGWGGACGRGRVGPSRWYLCGHGLRRRAALTVRSVARPRSHATSREQARNDTAHSVLRRVRTHLVGWRGGPPSLRRK